MEGESGILTSKHKGGQSVEKLKRRLYEWAFQLIFFFLSIYITIKWTIESVLYNSYLNIIESIVVLFGFILVASGHHFLVFRWSIERLRKYASISLVLILSGLLTVVASSRIGSVTMEGGASPLFVYGLFLGFIPYWYLFAYIRISGILLEKMECPSCGKMIRYEKGGEYIHCRFCGWTFEKIPLRKLIEDSIR